MGALGYSCAMIEQLATGAKRYSIVRVIKKLWIEAQISNDLRGILPKLSQHLGQAVNRRDAK